MPHTLAHLLQLSSPTLPVGAYTYSQGLEWAVEQGTVHDEASAADWIGQLLHASVARFEAPMVGRMMAAWTASNHAALLVMNHDFIASRETAELRAETLQMGFSMRRLLDELHDFPQAPRTWLRSQAQLSYPLAWSCAASVWGIAPDAALTAYLWAWIENQAMAALKAVPLGQAAGQRILAALGANLAMHAASALSLSQDQMSNFAPGFAIACARHETQYSRLFRS